MYLVKVWCGAGWFLMEVDDRIPCDAEKIPLLPRSNDELEIWPHLLVKAALKTGAFGDGSGSSSSSALFSLLISVLGGWSIVKHSGHLGVRHVLEAAASNPPSTPLPFVPVLVGAHPKSDALGRYSVYSHSVYEPHAFPRCIFVTSGAGSWCRRPRQRSSSSSKPPPAAPK